MAEFRGVNDELLFIKWRETYSETIQKTEQGDSDLVLQSSQYLHSRRQPWNYTENGIVMSGPLKILVYSHYGAGKRLHPHIIPCKRREAGCVSAGTAAWNEQVGVTLMKRLISQFLVWKYSQCSLSGIKFTLKHIIVKPLTLHLHRSACILRGVPSNVIKGRQLFLAHLRNYIFKEKRFQKQMQACRTQQLMSNQIIIRRTKPEEKKGRNALSARCSGYLK